MFSIEFLRVLVIGHFLFDLPTQSNAVFESTSIAYTCLFCLIMFWYLLYFFKFLISQCLFHDFIKTALLKDRITQNKNQFSLWFISAFSLFQYSKILLELSYFGKLDWAVEKISVLLMLNNCFQITKVDWSQQTKMPETSFFIYMSVLWKKDSSSTEKIQNCELLEGC